MTWCLLPIAALSIIATVTLYCAAVLCDMCRCEDDEDVG